MVVRFGWERERESERGREGRKQLTVREFWADDFDFTIRRRTLHNHVAASQWSKYSLDGSWSPATWPKCIRDYEDEMGGKLEKCSLPSHWHHCQCIMPLNKVQWGRRRKENEDPVISVTFVKSLWMESLQRSSSQKDRWTTRRNNRNNKRKTRRRTKPIDRRPRERTNGLLVLRGRRARCGYGTLASHYCNFLWLVFVNPHLLDRVFQKQDMSSNLDWSVVVRQAIFRKLLLCLELLSSREILGTK